MTTEEQSTPCGNIVTNARDNGKLLVNAEFAEILDANNLSTADSIWNLEGENVKKKLAIRGTERIALSSPDGENKIEAYLKRYLPLPIKEYVKNIVSGRPFFPDGAKHEWDAIIAFHAAEIATMRPIAVASLPDGRGALLTLGITDYKRASDIFAEWNPEEKSAERAKLVANIAELAAKMHSAGFAHQDFYLVHLFVLENLTTLPIDLQRIIFPDRFSQRWRVKDLGQLLYSARKFTTREERELFWEKYAEYAKNLKTPESLLKAVKRKADSIQKRAERKKER